MQASYEGKSGTETDSEGECRNRKNSVGQVRVWEVFSGAEWVREHTGLPMQVINAVAVLRNLVYQEIVISLKFIQRGLRPKSLHREYSDILFPRNSTSES